MTLCPVSFASDRATWSCVFKLPEKKALPWKYTSSPYESASTGV
jgi:hypothetical protein